MAKYHQERAYFTAVATVTATAGARAVTASLELKTSLVS